jgi:hypothetical protein
MLGRGFAASPSFFFFCCCCWNNENVATAVTATTAAAVAHIADLSVMDPDDDLCYDMYTWGYTGITNLCWQKGAGVVTYCTCLVCSRFRFCLAFGCSQSRQRTPVGFKRGDTEASYMNGLKTQKREPSSHTLFSRFAVRAEKRKQ